MSKKVFPMLVFHGRRERGVVVGVEHFLHFQRHLQQHARLTPSRQRHSHHFLVPLPCHFHCVSPLEDGSPVVSVAFVDVLVVLLVVIVAFHFYRVHLVFSVHVPLGLGNVRGVANVEAPHDAGIERTEIHDYHQVVDPRDRCGHGSSFVTFTFFFRYASSSSSAPAVHHRFLAAEMLYTVDRHLNCFPLANTL